VSGALWPRRLSLPGCYVEHLSIRCLNCDRGWAMASAPSVYDQQAHESCPCPYCGAYTLCCAESEEPLTAFLRPTERAL
jgi:hypothetical protein